ncbi:MAG: hypothetical protein Q9191_002224 [Dirinaria sp. TL-2023a]
MKIRLPSFSHASPLRTQHHPITVLPILSRHLLTSPRPIKGSKPAETPKPPVPDLIPYKDIITSTADIDELASKYSATSRAAAAAYRMPKPHYMHIFSHKHNTHITLTRPDGGALIKASTGILGFRKSQRGSYDAAFQLGKYVTERIQHQGLLREIKRLALVWRDFGKGRDAVWKVLLGSEGRGLRPRVVSVADATRVKFGGTRGRKPRRLG